MRNVLRAAGFAAAALTGFSGQATDFGPLMAVVHETWPTKTHLAVVADYAASKEEIQALAESAGDGCRITVVDLRTHLQLDHAKTLLVKVVKPDYLVLLPHDPQVWEGSLNATQLVQRVAAQGLPTIGTTPLSLAQGAVFAMGAATGMDILVTDKVIGTVEVNLPQRGTFLTPMASLGHGVADITVF